MFQTSRPLSAVGGCPDTGEDGDLSAPRAPQWLACLGGQPSACFYLFPSLLLGLQEFPSNPRAHSGDWLQHPKTCGSTLCAPHTEKEGKGHRACFWGGGRLWTLNILKMTLERSTGQIWPNHQGERELVFS